jgi:hypothetical protein
MVITITMAATIGRASIGISTGDAATSVTTGNGRNEVGIDTNGVKTLAITMPIDGRGVATGRAAMIGVASDSMTMGISVMGTISDTFGTVVSDCRPPTTRPRTSFVTTPLTSFGSRRMVVDGSALTITSC